jgi:hypothetical protein
MRLVSSRLVEKEGNMKIGFMRAICIFVLATRVTAALGLSASPPKIDRVQVKLLLLQGLSAYSHKYHVGVGIPSALAPEWDESFDDTIVGHVNAHIGLRHISFEAMTLSGMGTPRTVHGVPTYQGTFAFRKIVVSSDVRMSANGFRVNVPVTLNLENARIPVDVPLKESSDVFIVNPEYRRDELVIGSSSLEIPGVPERLVRILLEKANVDLSQELLQNLTETVIDVPRLF